MSTYFFTESLPTNSTLKDKYDQLVLKYSDINRYLYITSLNKLLSSLEVSDQKELIISLEDSEEAGQKWIKSKNVLQTALVEHLERSILAIHSQLL